MTGRILIIEGEPSLSQELTSALDKAGFAVVNVPNFPEALVKLAQFKPDLVITDVVLPGGDGMEACYQLHNIFGIPVVLLGEDSSDEVWGRVMEADADLYLVKPFSYPELVARVKAILRRYRRQEAPTYQNGAIIFLINLPVR
ncbi:Alkaline phosphatase synthesis transcriptional regulatory protein PhoP [subsurface metagenome]